MKTTVFILLICIFLVSLIPTVLATPSKIADIKGWEITKSGIETLLSVDYKLNENYTEFCIGSDSINDYAREIILSSKSIDAIPITNLDTTSKLTTTKPSLDLSTIKSKSDKVCFNVTYKNFIKGLAFKVGEQSVLINSTMDADALLGDGDNIVVGVDGSINIAYKSLGADLGFARSDDGGLTWNAKEITTGTMDDFGILGNSSGGIIIYYRASGHRMISSSDNGTTWSSAYLFNSRSTNSFACAIDKFDKMHCCLGAGATAYNYYYLNGTNMTNGDWNEIMLEDTAESIGCAIEIDSNNCVYIADTRATADQINIRTSCSNWESKPITTGGTLSDMFIDMSIANISGKDEIAIVATNKSTGATPIYFRNNTGSWIGTTVPNTKQNEPNIAMNHEGYIFVIAQSAAEEASNGFINYSYYNLTSWSYGYNSKGDHPSIADSYYPSSNKIRNNAKFVYVNSSGIYYENFSLYYVAPEWTDVTACGALSGNNIKYRLTRNVSASTNCISFRGNNLTLDGQGYTISFGSATATSYYGVYFETGGNNTIQNAFIDNLNIGSARGYNIYESSATGMSGNSIKNNIIDAYRSISGIYTRTANMNISNNNIYLSTLGVSTIGITSSQNNGFTLIGNNISVSNYGISMTNTFGNYVIINNQIKSTSSSALYQYGTSGNGGHIIYNNIFNGTSTSNIVVWGETELSNWNTSRQTITNIVGGMYLGGNYYGTKLGNGFSDIGCTGKCCIDSDSDGICENSYNLTIPNNRDYAPLTTPSPDTTNPLVNIINPVNDTWVNGNISIKTIASDDRGVNRVEFWAFNDTKVKQLVCNTTSEVLGYYSCVWDTALFHNGTEGWTFNVTVFDNAGNMFTDAGFWTIDRTRPMLEGITLTYPYGQTSVRNGQYVKLNMSATDGSEAGMNITLVNTTNVNGNITLSEMEFYSGGKGKHQWSFWQLNVSINAGTNLDGAILPYIVIDNATPIPNIAYGQEAVIIDNSAPYLTDVYHEPTEPWNNSIVLMSAVFHDNYDLDKCIFSINTTGFWINETTSLTGGIIDSVTKIKTVKSGNVSYRFYLFDDAGNINFTQGDISVKGNIPEMSIILNSPEIDYISKSKDVSFNWSFTNATASNCTLFLNNVENQTLYSLNFDIPYNISKQFTDEQTVEWRIDCVQNDTNVTKSSDTRILYIDWPPDVYFIDPTTTAGTYESVYHINANVEATESGLATIKIYLYKEGVLFSTQTGFSSPYFYNFTGLTDGNYKLNASACDFNWCNNTETRDIIITTPIIQPTVGINWIYPTFNINVTRNKFFNVTVNVSCHLSNCGETNVTLATKNTTINYYPNTTGSSNFYGSDQIPPSADIFDTKDVMSQTNIQNISSENGVLYNFTYAPAPLAKIKFNISQDLTKINSIGLYSSGYGYLNNGGTCGNYKMYVWNYTSSNWRFLTEHTTYTSAQSISYMFTDDFNDIINSVGSIDLLIMGNTQGDCDGMAPYLAIDVIKLNVTYNDFTIPNITRFNPFWTNQSNPRNISLLQNEYQLVTYWVNATGNVGNTYGFFAYANITSNMSRSNITNMWNVTIVSEFINTCTYSGSGDWWINCADNCVLSTQYELGANSVYMYGTGVLDIRNKIQASSIIKFNECNYQINTNGKLVAT